MNTTTNQLPNEPLYWAALPPETLQALRELRRQREAKEKREREQLQRRQEEEAKAEADRQQRELEKQKKAALDASTPQSQPLDDATTTPQRRHNDATRRFNRATRRHADAK